MAKPNVKLVSPTPINGTVPPRRRPNAELRPREYLTEAEVGLVMRAAGRNRNGHRDATMVLLAFRHGLRAAELVTLRWDNVDLAHGKLHVNRVKNGSPSVHPLAGTEIRSLRRLKRESLASPFVFVSERGAQLTRQGIAYIIREAGTRAKLGHVWPHMLRHSCGYHLANLSQVPDLRLIHDYLGHKNITHTVRYTKLAPGRFNGLF